jgi:hypothetical protein
MTGILVFGENPMEIAMHTQPVTYTYTAIPCDEPPPPALIRAAQRHADVSGEPVRIVCCWGYHAMTITPEVFDG